MRSLIYVGATLLVLTVVAGLGVIAMAQQTGDQGQWATAPAPTSKKASKAPPTDLAQKQPTAPSAQVKIPSPINLLLLIRTSLIALDQANKTSNYTVLRDFGGSGMQRFTTAQLSDSLAGLRQRHADLAAVTVVTPLVTQQPVIDPHGLMSLAGYFPTRPAQIEFQLVFQVEQGRWRLFGLNVAIAAAPPEAAQASGDSKATTAEPGASTDQQAQ
jgi:hypothetical protein